MNVSRLFNRTFFVCLTFLIVSLFNNCSKPFQGNQTNSSSTSSSTIEDTPITPPAGYRLAFSDNFDSYATTSCLSDGYQFGDWTSEFAGFGCNAIVDFLGTQYFSVSPQASVQASETHAGLILGPSYNDTYTLTAQFLTQTQLRKNSNPNPWEVAWIMWAYTDDTHFYYFVPKPNGWELGKGDPAYTGAQRFLASGSLPQLPVGQLATVKVIQTGNRIEVHLNGNRVVDFTDNESPYLRGRVGFYTEDATVLLKSMSVSIPQ